MVWHPDQLAAQTLKYFTWTEMAAVLLEKSFAGRNGYRFRKEGVK